MTTRKAITVGLIILIAAGTAFYAWWSTRAVSAIQWQGDYQTALQTAAAEDKLVLAYLHTDWCKFCRKLEAETFPSEEVRREANRFVWLKVNPETNEDGARLQQKYRVEGFPTILVLTGDGVRVDQIEGFLEPVQFVGAINGALQGAESFLSLRKKAAQKPDSAEVQYELGQTLLTKGEFLGASRAFEAVLKQDPSGREEKTLKAHYGLALALGSLGRYDESIKYLDAATAKAPKGDLQADIMILKAHILMSQGKKPESAKLLVSYLEKFPNHDKVSIARRLLMNLTSADGTKQDRAILEEAKREAAKAKSPDPPTPSVPLAKAH